MSSEIRGVRAVVRNRRVRLMDVAEAAGVSIATASHAIAGRPGVSEPVAERVREVARRLGYVADLNARALASGMSSVVGLIVHDVMDPYFAEMASSAIRQAAQHGLMVQICQTAADPEQELLQIRSLIGARVRAIIVAGSGVDNLPTYSQSHEELKSFENSGGRLVLVGRHFLSADSIRPENTEGARQLAEHIIGLSHTKVGVLVSDNAHTASVDRLTGIQQAFEAHGLGQDAIAICKIPFNRAGAYANTAAFVAKNPDVTALLCVTDGMASGVLRALRELGIRVPQDMSVTGFDDITVAADLNPALTTVRIPLDKIGELCIQFVLRSPTSRPRRKNLPCELVVRDSSAEPREGPIELRE